MSFDFEMALDLYTSNDPFPVDFDDAWKWFEFSRKDSAKRHFENCDFVENIDFVVLHITVESDNQAFLSPQEKAVLQKTQKIKLTVDCFKSWGMMIGTPIGKDIRKYFLKCEKIAKLTTNQFSNNLEELIDKAVDRALSPRIEKIEKYEKTCRKHHGAGYVIQSEVEEKKNPAGTITFHAYCKLRGVDKSLWNKGSKRYGQFTRVGMGCKPPTLKGKLAVYGDFFTYADAAIFNVMDFE